MTRSRLFAGLLLLFFLSIAITAIGQKPEKHAYIDIPEASWAKADPQVVVITRQVVVDYQCISAPGNPPAGLVRVYCDTSTGNLTCLTSSGASCISSSGGTITGSGTSGTVAKFTSSTAVGNSSVTDDGTNPTQTPNGTTAVTNGFYRQIANANPGSTLNRAVCLNSSAQAITCATNATSGIAGIAGQGAGNSGNVQVCMMGNCTAEFDNQSTVGDWAIPSTTTAGRLHDTGLTTETTGVQNFFVYSTNGGAGTTATVGILNPDVISGGSSGGGRGTNVQTNGTNAQPTLNLNSSTPAPGAGFVAMTVASSNSGNTTSAIAKVPISGNTGTVASASTISGTTNICGDGSGNLTTVGCTAAAIPGVTNVQGTTYTLQTSDNGKLVSVTNASAVTVTLPAPGGAAPQVQTSAETFITCNPTCTGKAFTPTAGDLVVLWIENNQDSTSTVTGVNATHATFLSAGAKQAWSTNSDTVWYAFNVGSGADTYTITMTGATVTLALHIVEYNNIQTSPNPKDAYQTASGTTAVPSSGNATINFNNELVTGMIPGQSCNLDTATGSGYTLRVADASMAANGMIEDKAVSTAGTYVADATAAGCANWAAILTSFRMTTAANFSNGFYAFIQNRGTSAVTLSGTIDGVSNLILQPTQGVLIETDGANWFTMRGQRQQTAIVSGAAYTNATTTFSNVVGGAGQTLQFVVAASTNYIINCQLLWSASVATAGPKFQFTGPASPTAVQYAVVQAVTATTDGTAGATAFSTSLNASGTTVVATTNEPAELSLGLLNGSTAGTVVLQAAAQGAGTLTIQPGSFCTAQQQ